MKRKEKLTLAFLGFILIVALIIVLGVVPNSDKKKELNKELETAKSNFDISVREKNKRQTDTKRINEEIIKYNEIIKEQEAELGKMPNIKKPSDWLDVLNKFLTKHGLQLTTDDYTLTNEQGTNLFTAKFSLPDKLDKSKPHFVRRYQIKNIEEAKKHTELYNKIVLKTNKNGKVIEYTKEPLYFAKAKNTSPIENGGEAAAASNVLNSVSQPAAERNALSHKNDFHKLEANQLGGIEYLLYQMQKELENSKEYANIRINKIEYKIKEKKQKDISNNKPTADSETSSEKPEKETNKQNVETNKNIFVSATQGGSETIEFEPVLLDEDFKLEISFIAIDNDK